MAIDPVCGLSVDKEAAVKARYGDKLYFFCSDRCEKNFAGNPLRYVNKSGSASSIEGTPTLTPDGVKEPFSSDSYQKEKRRTV